MPKFDDYTQKTAPEDTDIALILDKTANVNKKTPFSGVWNWIVSKLTSAVISQLETTNKSIVPAINELNSKIQIRLAYMDNATFTDFNDCPRNTAWWINPSIVTGNSPDAQFGVLESVGVLQRFTTIHGSYAIYTRIYANGVWDDWKKFIPAS